MDGDLSLIRVDHGDTRQCQILMVVTCHISVSVLMYINDRVESFTTSSLGLNGMDLYAYVDSDLFNLLTCPSYHQGGSKLAEFFLA